MNNLGFLNNQLWKSLKHCHIFECHLKVNNNYSSENFWPKSRWLQYTTSSEPPILFIIHHCIIKPTYSFKRALPFPYAPHWLQGGQPLSPILADPGLWLWRKPQCGEGSLQKNENRKCLSPWQRTLHKIESGDSCWQWIPSTPSKPLATVLRGDPSLLPSHKTPQLLSQQSSTKQIL